MPEGVGLGCEQGQAVAHHRNVGGNEAVIVLDSRGVIDYKAGQVSTAVGEPLQGRVAEEFPGGIIGLISSLSAAGHGHDALRGRSVIEDVAEPGEIPEVSQAEEIGVGVGFPLLVGQPERNTLAYNWLIAKWFVV